MWLKRCSAHWVLRAAWSTNAAMLLTLLYSKARCPQSQTLFCIGIPTLNCVRVSNEKHAAKEFGPGSKHEHLFHPLARADAGDLIPSTTQCKLTSLKSAESLYRIIATNTPWLRLSAYLCAVKLRQEKSLCFCCLFFWKGQFSSVQAPMCSIMKQEHFNYSYEALLYLFFSFFFL